MASVNFISLKALTPNIVTLWYVYGPGLEAHSSAYKEAIRVVQRKGEEQGLWISLHCFRPNSQTLANFSVLQQLIYDNTHYSYRIAVIIKIPT
jgi:hypothetical protein